MSRKNKLLIIGFLCAAAVAAVLFVYKNGGFLPGWIRWNERSLVWSVDKPDGSDDLSFVTLRVLLKNRKVSVSSTDPGTYGDKDSNHQNVIWNSPGGYVVQDAMVCDADRDGRDELLLLAWRIGRYGMHRPFFEKENDYSWSQHIFIYKYADGSVRSRWGASDLGMLIKDISFRDGCIICTDPDGDKSRWVWDSWGFRRDDTYDDTIDLAPDPEARVSFIAVGDNLIQAPIYNYAFMHNGDFDFMYTHIKDHIREPDVACLMHDTIYVDDPSEYSDSYVFCTPLGAGEAMVEAGFDVAACASNHAFDQGMKGIDVTTSFYDSNGITYLGVQPSGRTEYEPARYIEKNGIRFALLNYTFEVNGMKHAEECLHAVHLLDDEVKIRKDIAEARNDSDAVIVFVHWGTENAAQPDEMQQFWTQVFLEEGVDVVIGSHPHVLQDHETLENEEGHNMLVYYSLGNFISAQNRPEQVIGGMAEFTFSKDEEGKTVLEDYGLKKTVTHQAGGYYSVYMLEEYPAELAKIHDAGDLTDIAYSNH